MSVDAKAAFNQEVEQDDQAIDLFYAGLLIAQHVDQVSDLEPYILELRDLTAAIQPALVDVPTEMGRIEVLHQHLFEKFQFKGNSSDYYHPDNSFLNRVLTQRQGIPISLSVIYLTIGWRLDLPVYGIGIPNHFVVGYGYPDTVAYIDVFNQGKILDEIDLLDLAQLPESDLEPFRQEYLKPTPRKLILHRMLLNLKHIYVQQKNWENAYKVSDLTLLIHPNLPSEVRDRGLIAYRLNRLNDAIYDVRNYLLLAPKAKDAEWLTQHLQTMERKLASWN
ncbi:MAG: tetratricopeptide repeat protein [Chloroflexota bacterium]